LKYEDVEVDVEEEKLVGGSW